MKPDEEYRLTKCRSRFYPDELQQGFRVENPTYCPAEFFEERFAWLEYVGKRRFYVAFMRHINQWAEILAGLTLEECLEAIREQELLHP